MTTKVQITTAIALPKAQAEAIEKKLRASFDQNSLVFEYRVDTDVVGGIRVIVGSREFDGTLRTRLEQLRQTLTAQL